MRISLFAIVMALLGGCFPLSPFYWREIPFPVSDSENNYLKIHLPERISENGQTLEIQRYYITVLKDESGSRFSRRVLINPARDFSFWSYFLGTNENIFIFPKGCELAIPISRGERSYEIFVSAQKLGLSTELVTTANLAPSESLRLTLYVEEKPVKPDLPFGQDESSFANRVRLKASIEKTGRDPSVNVCKF